jgi:hypothetical protein
LNAKYKDNQDNAMKCRLNEIATNMRLFLSGDGSKEGKSENGKVIALCAIY